MTASPNPVCSDNSTTTLTVNGGTLGTDAVWALYDTDPTVGSPTRISTTTGTTFTVSPTVTTTYYVRYEDGAAPCTATGIAQSTTITVNDPSTDLTSLTASSNTVCSDNNTVTLTVNGGTLGTDAVWALYDTDPTVGSPTRISTTTGTTFTVNPTVQTTYYVRYEDGAAPCTATGTAQSTTIDVENASVDPTSLTGNPNAICSGGSTDLTINGGTLGSGAVWALYDTDPTVGSPTRISTTSGTTFTVSPTVTTTYYVRYEDATAPCASTGDTVQVTISVGSSSVAPSSISATVDSVCSTASGSVTFTATGGTLGTGAYYEWSDNGFSTVISGANTDQLTVSYPSATTTYSVRIVTPTPCVDTTTVISKTFKIINSDDAPTSVSISELQPCYGETITLTQVGGSLNDVSSYYEWATDASFTTVIGTTVEDTLNVTIDAPTTYYVRAVNPTCGPSASASASVNFVQAVEPSEVTGVLVSTTSTAYCTVDDSKWHYFLNSNGDVIAAINSNGQNLGDVSWTVTLGSNGPYDQPLNTLCTDGEYYLGRAYSFQSQFKATSAVSIRLFATPTEYTNFKNLSDAQAGIYAVCWGTTSVPSDLQVSAFYAYDGFNQGEAITSGSITFGNQTGPGSSYIYQFNLLPKYSSGGGRTDSSNASYNTKLYLHNTGGRGAVLPVELTIFTATQSNGGVALNWHTASESNNERFEVTRSTDGIHFETIGVVAGHGTTSDPHDYTFFDANVTNGTYYYQLKQVDFAGEVTYSKIVSVLIQENVQLGVGLFFPNPSREMSSVIISSPIDSKVVFTLYSINGERIISKEYPLAIGNNKIDVDVNRLPAGSYIGVFQTQDRVIDRKLIIQK